MREVMLWLWRVRTRRLSCGVSSISFEGCHYARGVYWFQEDSRTVFEGQVLTVKGRGASSYCACKSLS